MFIGSFINNEIHTNNSGSALKYNSLSPYSGEKLHEVQIADALTLVRAVQAANRAAAEWKDSTLTERISLVNRLRGSLINKADEYARREAEQQGLPLRFVKAAGLNAILQSLDSLISEVTEEPDPQSYSAVGVVAIIASWNLSLRVILDRLLPALLAGNAIIVKTSSASPITAQVLAELCTEAAVPAGLVNILVGGDAEFKKMLIAHPGVRAVSFCGQHETAVSVIQELSQSAGQTFKKLQISSGSKNSAVALQEPTDEIFGPVMESFMLGQGQLVWNSSRLFVLEKFEAQWRERIEQYLQQLKPAESVEDSSVWTPCLKENSFLRFAEISQLAATDQAKLITIHNRLSERQKKHYLPPVFTQDMSRCSTLQQDQIHAPFYILSAVKYPFDVAKYSNVSYYGFAAHLWGDREKLQKLGQSLDVGQVCLNTFSALAPGTVIGVKQSGYGLQDNRVFGAFFSNVKKISQ